MESAAMEDILAGKEAETAAMGWLKANPSIVKEWVKGVTTFNGDNGLASVMKHLGL
jgi:glycine betaine/proline transport system substrate-binding protein